MKRSFGAILMAVGIALCGYFIYSGIKRIAEKDRCVTVKGLSEREVLANRVVWPMSITLKGNDIDELCHALNKKKDIVVEYLKQNKIADKNIAISSIDITDRWNDDEDERKYTERYIASVDITVTSTDVPHILDLMKQQNELIDKGVRATSNSYNIKYEYTDLTSLKPVMVEEATKDARKVAEKFAEDANCEIGSIYNATQGLFTIDEEYYRPQYKKIRVVTTISYYLK